MPTANIKYIEDKAGDVFFPITHQGAVIDDNGIALNSALAAKQDKLSAGSNVTITNNVISATGTVTGVKMNNITNSPSSGIVDLGTILTSHQDISGKENSSNKVTSISSSSTDTQYPSAKCVYDAIQNSSSEWRLIRHDTLTNASNTIVILKDSDNNSFALSNVLVYIKLSTSPSIETTALINYRNSDQSITYSMPLVYTPYISGTTYDMRGINQVRILDGIIMPVLALTSRSDNDNKMVNFDEISNYYNVPIALDSVEYIQLVTYVNNGFPSGTEYYI